MQRFYFPTLAPTQTLTIRDEDFVHQISRVLRSAPGDEIVLFCGDGNEYLYTIASIAKKEVSLVLKDATRNTADPERTIRLYQALPNKYEKIEYILQKWVEIGISEFVFFPSERSQKLAINDRKIVRFQDIAREALEQCGGNRIPKITFQDRSGIPFDEDMSAIVLHTKSWASISLDAFVKSGHTDVACYVGPEGGWSDTEMELFRKNSVQTVHLGDRIMRTETAGTVVAFFLLQRA